MNEKQKITCPTCGREDTWQHENAFRPFCSDRCKLIDLGDWALERRRIPGKTIDPNLSVTDNNDLNDFNDHSL